MYFAETLSRAHQNNIELPFKNECNEIQYHLLSIVENMPMTENKFELFKLETNKDNH